jgi:hypothetical protein
VFLVLFCLNAAGIDYLCLLQNVYWADSGDLVTIASDSSFYILKYNVS